MKIAFDPAVWGTVSDWAAFVVAVIALFGAGYAAKKVYLNLTIPVGEDNARVQATRQHQAEQVTGWWAPRALDSYDREVMFHNASGVPVWDVRLLLTWGPESGQQRLIVDLGFQPSTDHPTVGYKVPYPPHEDWLAEIEIEFRDAGGLYWRRNQAGVLQEIRTVESKRLKSAPLTDWSRVPHDRAR